MSFKSADASAKRKKALFPATSKHKSGTRLDLDLERKAAIKEAFLISLRKYGNTTRAAEEAGIGRATAYNWREEDERFYAAWKDAEEAALDEIEGAIRTRAVEGWDEPVFFQGEVCGHVRKYSDSNGQFLLKAKRYRDRVEITGKDGEALPNNAPPMVVNFINEGVKTELRKRADVDKK